MDTSLIVKAIYKHRKKINELEAEKKTLDPILHAGTISVINNQLSYLRDNQYRYEMQAKAYGIEVSE